MTCKEICDKMREALAPLYGPGEAKAMIRLIFHSLKGWSQSDLIMNADTEISPNLRSKISDVISRLANGEPIQYILGEAYFYGMDLKVTPATLIPRPETSELVDMIVKQYHDRSDLRVLDVGTGSGAIAIALSRNLPFSKVTAIDVSTEALQVARDNANTFSAKINFIETDVFKWMPAPDSFDIIVSNPPYIDESEKSEMERNVLEHEPHLALFVPDENPLIYYSRIIEIARPSLAPHGALFFEINPRHSAELAALLRHEGFRDVEIVKDISRKDRFITASKNE